MTSIEWLIEELEGSFSIIARAVGVKKYNEIVRNAIEMHKQEMSDSYQNGWMSCEKWFEDKELDDHIVDTNEMVEISDEQIESKAASYFDKHCDDWAYDGFKDGAKWYREQLKEK